MALTNVQYPTIRYEGKDWAGLTTSNHLGALFGEQPYKISKYVDTIYSVSLQEDLVSKLNALPIEYIPTDGEYEWMLMGADTKAIPLEKATDLAGGAFTAASKAGQYNSRFYLYFKEKLFFKTHVIVGNKPDLYHLLIVEEPQQVGTSFRYTVELVVGDGTVYVPYGDLAAGTRWSADYSLSSQILSDTGSDMSFTSPFKMANTMSMIRKKYTVSGDMINKKGNGPVVFDWQYGNNNGKTETFSTWLNRLDFEFDKAFRRERARLVMFGKSNRTANGRYANIGDSGYEIRSGMGLRDQISPANVKYYTQFDIEELVNFAMTLSVGKLDMDSRRFVIGTGEWGLKMVSAAVEKYAGANAIKSTTGNGIDYNRMETLKGTSQATYTRPQFNKLIDINGLTFEFIHFPEYDDETRYKVYHPEGGLVESRRLTIMDFGTHQGHPNIQLVRQKDQPEVMGYIPGLRDPFAPGSPMKPKQMSTATDGYEIHRADWISVKVHNPLRMGEYIYNAV